MFSGGTDTSIVPIEWALVELLANPEKMALLQNELAEVVGNTKLVSISDLPNLPYLSAVVKETMRMHPALPLLVPHRLVTQSCELLGYEIRANTQVYINVWAIGHDPSVWDNPWEFRPERFLDSSPLASISVRGVNFDFLPFGSGRRMCPGLPLAMLMVEFILGSLVHSFEWMACGEPKVNEVFRLLTKPESPLVLKPYPKEPLQNLL